MGKPTSYTYISDSDIKAMLLSNLGTSIDTPYIIADKVWHQFRRKHSHWSLGKMDEWWDMARNELGGRTHVIADEIREQFTDLTKDKEVV